MPVSPRCLVSLLASKQNNVIPNEKHVLHDANWSFKSDKYCILNIQNHPEFHVEIKDTMISTFYREAPVPTALNLGTKCCRKTYEFVQNEIGSALKSGSSIVYTKPKDNKIIGIFLNLIWQRNDEYEVIGASAKSWHNAAAEVIARDPKNNDNHLIWRNYQFQHIYDMGQNLLRQVPEKKYALYLSTGYINPEFRRSGSSSVFEITRLKDYHLHWNLTDCVIYFMTTFSKMDERIKKHYSNYKQFDYVGYDEQELILDGHRCFEKFRNLGGITYYVDFLRNFSYKT